MTDIPIIFSDPMVRALLSGRKTMTRRLSSSHLSRAKPGDRLWVREGLRHVQRDPVTAKPCSLHCYAASVPPGRSSANPYEDNYLFPDENDKPLPSRNVPSIHMPRWASRLTLVVVATRVELLQEISAADAEAEGVFHDTRERTITGLTREDRKSVAVSWFKQLWNTLHGPDSWNENPEVVVLTFRIIRANVDAPEALAA